MGPSPSPIHSVEEMAALMAVLFVLAIGAGIIFGVMALVSRLSRKLNQ